MENPSQLVISRKPLTDKSQTAAAMYDLVEKFATDVKQFANLPLPKFFRKVANMPYKQDRAGREVVARPWWGMALARGGGIDCKKKSIIIAAWFRLRGIPFRFVGSSSKRVLFGKPPIHHVFPQGYFCADDYGCEWRNVDATYPQNRLFQKKPHVTRAVIFER